LSQNKCRKETNHKIPADHYHNLEQRHTLRTTPQKRLADPVIGPPLKKTKGLIDPSQAMESSLASVAHSYPYSTTNPAMFLPPFPAGEQGT
jgi:hypothetical protein